MEIRNSKVTFYSSDGRALSPGMKHCSPLPGKSSHGHGIHHPDGQYNLWQTQGAILSAQCLLTLHFAQFLTSHIPGAKGVC